MCPGESSTPKYPVEPRVPHGTYPRSSTFPDRTKAPHPGFFQVLFPKVYRTVYNMESLCLIAIDTLVGTAHSTRLDNAIDDLGCG